MRGDVRPGARDPFIFTPILLPRVAQCPDGRAIRASDYLNQSVALAREFDDAREACFEPCVQYPIGRIAHSQPRNRRPGCGVCRTGGKILVLGHDDGTALQGMRPNRTIVSFAQADILDVLRFVTRFAQPTGEGGRQLSIDQKFHLASDKTA